MSVQSYLNNTASELVLSGLEKTNIKASIKVLKRNLKEHFGSEIEEHFIFGSYTRNTILPRWADENSDVDYMIIFKNLENYKPATFITQLTKFANTKYSKAEIYRSHPTCVLELNHIKFELVPAKITTSGFLFWTKNNIKVPAKTTDDTDWMKTNPNEFNEDLTIKNKRNNNKIKPLIRVMKFWNAQNGYIFPSYKLEQNIVNTGYSRFSTNNLKDYFFEYFNTISTSGLSQSSKDIINTDKEILAYVHKLDKQGESIKAEREFKKYIIPIIK